MSDKPYYLGWAAITPKWGYPPMAIHIDSVSDTRVRAQECIGEAWAHEGETARQGWKRAYRAGWRAKRVAVRLS
jgi:hypothetical protein